MAVSSAESVPKSEPISEKSATNQKIRSERGPDGKTKAKKVGADLSALGKMEMNIGTGGARKRNAPNMPEETCHTGSEVADVGEFEEELSDYLETLTAQSPGMIHLQDVVHIPANITEEPMFNIFIASMIGLNALQMGLAHMIPKDATDPSQLAGAWPDVFQIFENIFTVIFLLEAMIKLWYMRVTYFKSPWNIIDFVLVWVAMIDNWILQSLADGGSIKGFTALRVFRLVRVARVVKLLRSNKHIRVLLEGLASSLVGMVPIAVMLGLSIYAMSLVALELILEDQEKLETQEVPLNVDLYFGNFWRTSLTLFSMVILAEWGNIIWPIAEQQPVLVVLICFFVLVCAFGLMNVIIGIICEKTNEASEQVKDEVAETGKSLQMGMVKQMVHALIAVDTNDDGTIDYNELSQPHCRALMEQLGLPKGFDGNELLQMLDFDGSGNVTKREFAMSMFRLIHADDFQGKCLQALHFNSIKQLTRIVATQQASAFNIVLEELASIKDMLRGLGLHTFESTSAVGQVQETKASHQMPVGQKLMEMKGADIRLEAPQFPESYVPEAEIKMLLERMEQELQQLGNSVAFLRQDVVQQTAKIPPLVELEEQDSSPPVGICFKCADRPSTAGFSPPEHKALEESKSTGPQTSTRSVVDQSKR